MPCHHTRIAGVLGGAAAPQAVGEVGKVTLFFLPEVFCGPQICQKMRWRPRLRPGLRWGAHDAPPDPSRLWRGIASLHSLSHSLRISLYENRRKFSNCSSPSILCNTPMHITISCHMYMTFIS